MITIEEAVNLFNEVGYGYDPKLQDYLSQEWVVEDEPDGTKIACLIEYITEYKDVPWGRDENDIRFLLEYESIAVAQRIERERNGVYD